MHQSWKEKLQPLKGLAQRPTLAVRSDHIHGVEVYPPIKDRFNAFNMPFDSVKVVIVGQDPYHGPGQANGLAFSVNKGIKIPPSLVNIYKELHDDLGCSIPNHGDLNPWVEQGVLLLNTSLSVQRGQANSHKDYGWVEFTKGVMDIVSSIKPVFILWGRHAQTAAESGRAMSCHRIKSAHPSPLSAHNGFFGSKPFSKCNEYLKASGRDPINWEIK